MHENKQTDYTQDSNCSKYIHMYINVRNVNLDQLVMHKVCNYTCTYVCTPEIVKLYTYIGGLCYYNFTNE